MVQQHHNEPVRKLKKGCVVYITFDNAKKRGRALRKEEAEVAIFTSGRVVIDTDALPKVGFNSLREAKEYLDEWGNHEGLEVE